MQLERRGEAITVIRDDGSARVIDGVSLAARIDYGLSNWYGTELRSEWEEAHLHRHEGALFITVTHLYEGCADLSESLRCAFRSDDGGATWVRAGAGLTDLTENTVIAAVTTHPSQQPFYQGIRKGSIFGSP